VTTLQEAGAIAHAGPSHGEPFFSTDLVAPSRIESTPLTAKRCLDILGASIALFLAAPMMIAIYLALLLAGGKPVFAHRRVGRNGRLFYCYKFRSMVRNADAVLAKHLSEDPAARAEWGRSQKLLNDPRTTPFGSFLRRNSLDELPQLFNVLRGDMSLVGPRPIVPGEVERYSDRIGDYYRCRPGITGLWQVSGRNLVSYQRRVRLDAFYARRQSVRLDAIIMLRTVWVVLTGYGAS
jgi:exopolysaccharide production protein ExoY